MNPKIVLIAQEFCATYFCDSAQEIDSYMHVIDSHLSGFETPEEKVQFLLEVKRLGNLAVKDALNKIEGNELLDISKL